MQKNKTFHAERTAEMPALKKMCYTQNITLSTILAHPSTYSKRKCIIYLISKGRVYIG